MTDRLFVSEKLVSSKTLDVGDCVYFPKESTTNFLTQNNFLVSDTKQTFSKQIFTNLFNKFNVTVPNIIDWTPSTILGQQGAYNVYVNCIEYAFGKFWTFGTGANTKTGPIYEVINSTNAINWTAVSLATSDNATCRGIFIQDKLFTRVANSTSLFTTNGINWTTFSSNLDHNYGNSYGNGRYFVDKSVSTNGINWTTGSVSSSYTYYSNNVFNNTFYLFSKDYVVNSTNGINWTTHTYYLSDNVNTFTVVNSGIINNKIIALTENGSVYNSTNAINWDLKVKTAGRVRVDTPNMFFRNNRIIQNQKCLIYLENIYNQAESLIYSEDGENFYNILNKDRSNHFYIRSTTSGYRISTDNIIWGSTDTGNVIGGVVTYSAHKYANLYNYNTTTEFVLNTVADDANQEINLCIKHA